MESKILLAAAGVYSSCDGPRLSRGPYLGVTTACLVLSVIFVSWKAVYVFGGSGGGNGRVLEIALFVCSYALAVGHIVAAYRTSCRERRKLLVYRIDMEAVSVSASHSKQKKLRCAYRSNLIKWGVEQLN